MGREKGKREKLDILRQKLLLERASFEPQWKQLGCYMRPQRVRLSITEGNKGHKRNQMIIDSTASLAARTLSAGMMSGITSPARPWFKLSVPNKQLAEFGPVKIWLQTVTERMLSLFLKSNLYNVLPVLYSDIGVFGTSAVFMEEDFETVARFYSFPIGSYMLGTDDKGRVRIFIREFRFTVRQVVEKFASLNEDGGRDFSNISEHVKILWDKDCKEEWIDIVHAVVPNDDFDPDKIESKFKRYLSVYYERGTDTKNERNHLTDNDKSKFLSEKGYNHFPVLAPRWETSGEDVYGTDCPGILELGDVKALQTLQKRMAQAIEKLVNPAMTGSSALRNNKPSILPGDITYEDVREGQKGFRPVHEVDPRVQEVLLLIQDHQKRIDAGFFKDLFLMISQSDRREITATEIDARQEEKLFALGPVLEQLNEDLLDPLIDNMFNFANEQGMFPEPPEELQGAALKVEYVSVAAQAQKLVGLGSLERFMRFTGEVSQLTGDPTNWDKVDVEQAIDVYADRLGVDVTIVRPDEEVDEIKQGRAEQQAQAQRMEAIAGAADTAKTLSEADLEKDSALKQMLQGAEG